MHLDGIHQSTTKRTAPQSICLSSPFQESSSSFPNTCSSSLQATVWGHSLQAPLFPPTFLVTPLSFAITSVHSQTHAFISAIPQSRHPPSGQKPHLSSSPRKTQDLAHTGHPTNACKEPKVTPTLFIEVCMTKLCKLYKLKVQINCQVSLCSVGKHLTSGTQAHTGVDISLIKQE